MLEEDMDYGLIYWPGIAFVAVYAIWVFIEEFRAARYENGQTAKTNRRIHRK